MRSDLSAAGIGRSGTQATTASVPAAHGSRHRPVFRIDFGVAYAGTRSAGTRTGCGADRPRLCESTTAMAVRFTTSTASLPR
jgi:hypothetical protein